MYFTRRRSSASSSTVAQGCSAYSRSYSASAWMRVFGFVDVPGAVRVDADPAFHAEHLAHGRNAGDVISEALPGLGDLHFRGAAAVEVREHVGHGCRGHSRHGGIHRDLAAQRSGLRRPSEVDRCGEPRRCLIVVVFDERRELGPALGSLEDGRLADVDAAEANCERQGDDARRTEDVVERREGCRSVVAHGSIMPCQDSRPSPSRTARSHR